MVRRQQKNALEVHILPLQFLSSTETAQSYEFELSSCHMKKRVR